MSMSNPISAAQPKGPPPPQLGENPDDEELDLSVLMEVENFRTAHVLSNVIPANPPSPPVPELSSKEITASIAAMKPEDAPKAMERFMDLVAAKVPNFDKNARLLTSNDDAVENIIKDLLKDPDLNEAQKIFGDLFPDKESLKTFLLMVNEHLNKQRDKFESAARRAPDGQYKGLTPTQVKDYIQIVFNKVANKEYDAKAIEAAKKHLNLDETAKPVVIKSSPVDEKNPFANFKNNESAIYDKFLEIAFPDNPPDSKMYMEAGSTEFERAIQKQLLNAKKYLPLYGGLIKDTKQLEEFLDKLMQHLDKIATDKKDAEGEEYKGMAFGDIKKEIRNAINDLADNKLRVGLARLLLREKGGPAEKVSYEYVKEQILLWASEQEKLSVKILDELKERFIQLEDRARFDKEKTSTVDLKDEFLDALRELVKESEKLTKEQLEIAIHKLCEDYKMLLFEREIREKEQMLH